MVSLFPRFAVVLKFVRMTGAITILVVEDEVSIRTGLCDVLALHGYVPTGVESGEDGLTCALAQPFDLVILDVMLPGMNGFDVCRELRARLPLQAILMLTARAAESDVVHGFQCGADDYVTKPFSVAELMARVEALLRRSGQPPKPPPSVFQFGPWQVDPVTRRAEAAGQTADLSGREVELLLLFARERGRIVSRRMLLLEVWGLQHVDSIETRTVDMHLAKLRKKVSIGGSELIETVRGEGYRFRG